VSSSLTFPFARGSQDERGSDELDGASSALLLLGALSAVTGVIHVGISASDFQLSSAYTPPVAMFAAFQLGWGALVVLRPSRGALLWGAGANAAIAAIWVVSRTVGLPIGPQPWVPEPIGVVDVIAAAAESVVALASACVALSARSALARRTASRMAPALLAVLFVCALYGTGGGGHIGGGGSVWLCG
jgi:hypothetical protein